MIVLLLPFKFRFLLTSFSCLIALERRQNTKRIDAFQLGNWRRLLKVPWTARRSNQSVLTEINLNTDGKTDTEAEVQYFDHLMQTDADSLEKSLMLGKIEGRRKRGYQRTRSVDGITDAMDMN